MKIYVGRYWIPFPQSEHGGMWVVIANDDAHCTKILRDYLPSEFNRRIKGAVNKAARFELKGAAQPGVVQSFTT